MAGLKTARWRVHSNINGGCRSVAAMTSTLSNSMKEQPEAGERSSTPRGPAGPDSCARAANERRCLCNDGRAVGGVEQRRQTDWWTRAHGRISGGANDGKKRSMAKFGKCHVCPDSRVSASPPPPLSQPGLDASKSANRQPCDCRRSQPAAPLADDETDDRKLSDRGGRPH